MGARVAKAKKKRVPKRHPTRRAAKPATPDFTSYAAETQASIGLCAKAYTALAARYDSIEERLCAELWKVVAVDTADATVLSPINFAGNPGNCLVITCPADVDYIDFRDNAFAAGKTLNAAAVLVLPHGAKLVHIVRAPKEAWQR